jgi:hypothetical protein
MKGLLMGKAADYVTEVKGPGQVGGHQGEWVTKHACFILMFEECTYRSILGWGLSGTCVLSSFSAASAVYLSHWLTTLPTLLEGGSLQNLPTASYTD